MPPATRKTSRAQRREELSRRLLVVVEQLLADGGTFAELSIAQLIERANIARSTFYVYFEDRSALLESLGATVADDLATAADAWGTIATAPTQDDVRAALATVVDAYVRHRVVVVAIGEAANYDAAAREQHDALLAQQTDALVAAIERDDLDVARVSAWLVWMTDRGIRQLVVPASPRAHGKLLDALADIVWKTLRT